MDKRAILQASTANRSHDLLTKMFQLQRLMASSLVQRNAQQVLQVSRNNSYSHR